MKRYFTLLATVCVILLSCTDDLNPQNGTSTGKLPPNSVAEPNMESLHTLQTDKQIMLSSMIRYNSDNGKFVLDLSFYDAKSLGISEESYNKTIELVTQMNESNIIKTN